MSGENGKLGAFPSQPLNASGMPQFEADPGLTKREYFAAMALQGIMGNPERWKQIADDYKAGKKTYEQCSQANAAKAVSLADALLAELEKAK